MTSGSNVLGQFTIAQFVNGSAILTVLPGGTTTFTGPDTVTCNAGGQATFYIFGGTPPYTVETNFPQAVLIRGDTGAIQRRCLLDHHDGHLRHQPDVHHHRCNRPCAHQSSDGRQRRRNRSRAAAGAHPTPSSLSVTCSPGTSFTFLASGGTGTYINAVNPEAGATGTATVSPSGANVTVSFSNPPNLTNASGKFDVNVASGSQVVRGVLTCN